MVFFILGIFNSVNLCYRMTVLSVSLTFVSVKLAGSLSLPPFLPSPHLSHTYILLVLRFMGARLNVYGDFLIIGSVCRP